MSDAGSNDGLKPELKDLAKAEAKQRAKAFGKQIKQVVKELSPERRDALMRRLMEAAQKAHGHDELLPLKRDDQAQVPLSFAQEREWFRDRMFPGIAHNISGALVCEGQLSMPALQGAFDAILRRHEVLRATFRAPQGTPLQNFTDPSPLPIPVVELSHLPPAARDTEWRRLYAEEIARGFDLSRDLLLRATLLRLADHEHVLLITMHHIVSDGWSIGVLVRELSELYRARVHGREAHLPEVGAQYADYASWQRRRMTGGALEAGLAYWRSQMTDLPPVLELPAELSQDEPRPAERDHEGATCGSRVEPALKQDLEELSGREDTTLFVTLLTAFMVLMMRCTGREDVVIGSPVSGRTRVETERLIGLFLNTLAFRVQLTEQLTFREAMAMVRRTVLDGLEHADVPIERIVQDLDLERSVTGHPLYETIFNFTPSSPRRLELPELRVRFEEPPALIEEFSTQLFVTEWEGALDLDLRYRRRRYSEARMACFLEQYLAVLQQVARDADRTLGSLDLATARSRALLPDPTVPLDEPAHRPVPATIADWVARTPDQPAICWGPTTVSYAQLGAAMTDVANTLHGRGLRPGDVVAVLGPRSPEVVISMAGALLAGGVLLTLSPDLPEQRHRLMLGEAGARFLLVAGEWRAEDRWVAEVAGLTVIHGIDASASARSSTDLPDCAYVFFTSGSTGKPKAVLGTHAGLAHWLQWQRQMFSVGPSDRCGQLTGLSFDVVLRDVFLPLTSGATLVIPSGEEDTLQWLEREEITLLHSVPSVMEAWLSNRPAGVSLPKLQRLFVAGEPLTSALVARWREACPNSGAIVNIYGPTETTLAKCYYLVPARPRAGIQPLGHALPQSQALVLTANRDRCGIGEPGEIAIRTPFRTRGYLNAPEENETRFIVNPFRNDPADLVYLTGDRGVYGGDGLLEFRGRIDQQVKVRGVRVEPMEVTVTLQECPDVASCAVIAREDGPEGLALVAYVVLKEGLAEDAGRLQQFLAQRLPAAMVPSAVVFLERLPLTSNQKLDRAKLPPPSRTRPAVESRYVPPRDAIELRLVQIWEELLDVRPIGVTDRFFEVGGHSLLALRLLVDVEQKLARKVPLPALFEEPTIEHLAAVLRQKDERWPMMVTLRAGDHPLKLFLVHPGGGTLLNYVHLIRHLPADIPVHGIQARGLDGASEPHETVEQMAADYIEEIRRLQRTGPYLLAGHSFGGVVAFEMARQLQRQSESIAFLGMFDSVAPLSAHDHDAPGDGDREDARRLTAMAEAIGRFLGKRVDVSYEQLAALSADDQIDSVVEALKRTRALPPGDEQKLIRNLLHVSKAHIRGHRAYQPEAVAVPITLFRVEEARQSDYPSAAPHLLQKDSLGWDGLTTAGLQIVKTSGNHVTMLSAAHAEGLANLLRPRLYEAMEASTHV
jgi:amino acid adenylation domain-containing protein